MDFEQIIRVQVSGFRDQGREYGLYALMAAVVFSAVPGYQAPDGHNFTAYYAITLAAVMFLPLAWPLKLFAAAAAASCAWLQFMIANVAPRELSRGFFRLYLSANADYQFILIFIALYALVIVTRPDPARWLALMRWIALVEVLRISAQRLGWDPFYVGMGAPITAAAGSQGNIGWSGMVLAMCAVGFFRPRLWWGLVPVVMALVVERSVTPAAALAGAVCMYAFFRCPLKTRLCVVSWAILAVILYVLFDPGDSRRFANWARGIHLSYVRESWLLGYGLGSWIMLFPEPGASFHRAHNEALQVWFELGFAGVAAMLFYGRYVALNFIKHRREQAVLLPACALAAVALCSMGNFPFHLAGTAAIAVGWMAMFEAAIRDQGPGSREGSWR